MPWPGRGFRRRRTRRLRPNNSLTLYTASSLWSTTPKPPLLPPPLAIDSNHRLAFIPHCQFHIQVSHCCTTDRDCALSLSSLPSFLRPKRKKKTLIATMSRRWKTARLFSPLDLSLCLLFGLSSFSLSVLSIRSLIYRSVFNFNHSIIIIQQASHPNRKLLIFVVRPSIKFQLGIGSYTIYH